MHRSVAESVRATDNTVDLHCPTAVGNRPTSMTYLRMRRYNVYGAQGHFRQAVTCGSLEVNVTVWDVLTVTASYSEGNRLYPHTSEHLRQKQV
jgi:hypothetical protein